jgi:hypothetical protein
MKYLITIILLIITIASYSQNQVSNKEIDEQIWKPFMKSFGNGNDLAFQSLHSKSVIRVVVDGNQIYGFDEYFKPVPDSIKAKGLNYEKSIEIRHLKRVSSDDNAFEVGYYKTSYKDTRTGSIRSSYGKFTVLLKKENEFWKIVMDADANEGTNEKIFRTGKKVE